MSRLLTSAAVIALMCSAASAADIPVFEPPPQIAPVAPVFSWTGIYLGVQGGYGWADFERETLGVVTSEWDVDGGIAGGHIGAQYQWNWLVLGVEGDIEWAGLEGDDGGAGGVLDETEFNWLASARGRLGVAWDRVHIYGTGGWQWADMDIEQTLGGASATFDETFNGWTAGGGVEVAFTDSIIAGLEYRYTDLGDEDFAAAGPFAAGSYEVDDFHAIRGRLSWKFGGLAGL